MKKAAACLVRPLILENTDKEQWNKYPRQYKRYNDN